MPVRGAEKRAEAGAASHPEVEPSTALEAPDEFRFPAEERVGERGKRYVKTWWSILLWIVVSLGIVAICALLVNFVLPGPPR